MPRHYMTKRQRYRDRPLGNRRGIMKRSRRGMGQSLTITPSGNQPYVFTRYAPEQFLDEANVAVLTAATFQLNQLPDYTDFTNIFQEYQLTKVTMYVYPKSNVLSPTTLAVQDSSSIFWVAFDPNDGSNPTSINDIRQLSGAKIHYGFKPFKFTFYPKTQIPVVVNTAGPTFGYRTGTKSDWCNTDYPDIDFGFLKMGIPGNNNTASQFNSYSINFKYTIACRRIK